MERKEAIDVVRSNFPNGRIQLSEALKTLIPELEENENVDDGIRKDLIEFVQQYGDNYYGQFSKASAISWLEKQGEYSKPDTVYRPHNGNTDNPYDMSFEEAQRYASERGIDIPINDGDVFDDEKYTTQTVGNILRWADEHPKQSMNTPEWTEDDTHTLNWICRIIYRAKQDRLITFEEEISLGKWMDKWLNYSPEWNEADKKMLESIIECIDGTGLLDTDQIDWIKSLKPHKVLQPEEQGKYIKFLESIQIGDEVTRNSDGVLVNLSQLKRVANKGENQGNSTPGVNKEEQKDFFTFHEGDWIVANDWVNTNTGTNTFLIKNITCGYGSLEDTEGVVHYPCLLSENFFHPWTIRDAKDGDVLTYGLDDGKVLIMIYEGLGKSFDGEVAAHALLDGDGYFSSSVGSVCCKFMELLTPATKEQRDLLFQKMKEAGYKWDAENKKLRGRESADNVKPKFEIGDLIKRKGKNVTFRVDRIQGGYYHCDQQYGSFFPIEEQDEWELIERKKINLINILKYYPKETRLFSPSCGYIWLAEVDEENGIITCYKNPLECGCTRATLGLEETISFYSDGTTGLPDYSITNDCMLFLDMNRTPIDKMGPKFNIGDWIVEKDLDEFGRGIIVAIRDGKYVLNTGRSVPIKEQDEWELVKKDF